MACVVINIVIYLCAAGTGDGKTYTLISALHALNSDTTAASNMDASECQDSSYFNRHLVQGNLLICSYSIRFVLGLSTVKKALQTAKNLSAAGVVFYMDPYVLSIQVNPTPLDIPGIIIPTPEASKVSFPFLSLFLLYALLGYNSQLLMFGALYHRFCCNTITLL